MLIQIFKINEKVGIFDTLSVLNFCLESIFWHINLWLNFVCLHLFQEELGLKIHKCLRWLCKMAILTWHPYSYRTMVTRWFFWSWNLVYTLATDLCKERWNFKLFSQNSRGNLKNHCTSTRLVCTYFYAFCTLNPNMAMKIWISKILKKLENFGRSSALDIGVERVIRKSTKY